MTEVLERPEGAPDHPYYHMGEMSPEELHRFEDRQIYAREFFFQFADFYKMQDYRLKNPDKLWPEARREAEVIGELTPNLVTSQFNQYRQQQIEDAKQMIEKDRTKSVSTEYSQHWLTCAENLTLRDVHLFGTWQVLHIDDPYSTDSHARPLFPEIVNLVEQAIQKEPKKLTGSPALPSPPPPDVIEGKGSKQ